MKAKTEYEQKSHAETIAILNAKRLLSDLLLFAMGFGFIWVMVVGVT